MRKSSVVYYIAGVLAYSAVACTYAKQVCYGKYGCFSDDPPFDRTLVPLPQDPKDIGLTYSLMTRKQPIGTTLINDHDVSLLQSTSYDGSKRTIIIVHGWIANSARSWQLQMGEELIAKEDVNVILAGWREGAREFYTISVANTRLVGAQITELIKFLNKNTNNSPKSFHLIGFSLGAHIVGYVGRRLQNEKLDRITGLDPASPYYKDEHVDVRLDPSDADFVDVIHSNSPMVGTPTKSGHFDFWPNGGELQPGCSLTDVITDGVGKVVKCNHYRAREFYIDSIASTAPFRSYRCSSWAHFIRGKCLSCGKSNCPEMGHNAIKYKAMPSGNFFSHTNEDRPYAVNRYAMVTLETRDGWMADGHNPRIRIYGDKGNSGKIRLAEQELHEGSREAFIAPIKSGLGNLKSIDVWHSPGPLRPLDPWRLNKLTIELMDTHENTLRVSVGGQCCILPHQRTKHLSKEIASHQASNFYTRSLLSRETKPGSLLLLSNTSHLK